MKRAHVHLLPALLVLACDGGETSTDDPSGDTDASAEARVYRTTSYAVAADCASWDDDPAALPYFEVVPTEDGREVRKCRAADACDSFADADLAFALEGEDWVSLRTWAGHHEANGGSCSFHARLTTLVERPNGKVVIESAQVEAGAQVGPGFDVDRCKQALDAQWEPSFRTGTKSCWKLEGQPAE